MSILGLCTKKCQFLGSNPLHRNNNSSVSSGVPPIQVSFIIEYKKVYFYFLLNEIMLLFQVYGISNTTRDI